VSYQLGGLYLRTARIGRAAHVFRQSEALSPTYVPPHAGLARAAWERGNLGAAIRGYRWVVARLPLPEYVIALGDLYTEAGRTRQADDAYALAGTEATLFRANGVNVDVEPLFEADHGDPAAAPADAKAGGGAPASTPATRRVGLAAQPLPSAARQGTMGAASRHPDASTGITRRRSSSPRDRMRRGGTTGARHRPALILYAPTSASGPGSLSPCRPSGSASRRSHRGRP
jgi:hypothetical protein